MKDFLKKLQKYILFLIIATIGFASLFLFFNEFLGNKYAKVIFLDVGQGDSILIITPNGRQVLVDAGRYSDISEKIAKYMPISDRSIDMVIATHPDVDHISGFDTLLDEYDIGMFIHSGLLAGAPIYRSIANKVHDKKNYSHAAIAGEKITLDKNMYLEVLSPYVGQKIEDPNSHSVVVRLVYNNHAILLTGDAPKLVEQNIVSMYGKSIHSDILKLGHHGSKNSSDENFVKTVDPKYGIISAGCHNHYGHPHASVLRILDNNAITELSTCKDGDIVFDFINGAWKLENKKR